MIFPFHKHFVIFGSKLFNIVIIIRRISVGGVGNRRFEVR